MEAMRFDPSSDSTDAIVLRQVVSRARSVAVPGRLGISTVQLLDALDAGDRAAEGRAFERLTAAHRAAMAVNGNLSWCLERIGGDRDLVLLGREVDACARRLDDAFADLAGSRTLESPWRAVARLVRRRPAPFGRDEAAREYALAAMAFSRQVDSLSELLDELR
jgi:hypothetical protein